MNSLNLTSCIRFALYCSLAASVYPGTILARDITFDTSILESRGISKNLADYFSETPRYLPGEHTVAVKINGQDKGSMAVRFGDQGQLCIDADFLSANGLMPEQISKDEACHDLRSTYPSAVVNPLPNNESLELFVPAEALDSGFLSPQHFVEGGTAGLLNYNLYTSRNDNSDSNSSNNYSQADLEAGLNVAEWTVRSHYLLTDDDGERSSDSLYTYAEHVFRDQKVRAQVGQINVSSSLFSGASIDGIQFRPEGALQQNLPGVTVNGLAHTHQARVEVRQGGQLIYTTPVNAGPFTLNNVPVVRTNTDLDVKVVETDGSSTHFTIPASAFHITSLRPEGLTMSMGRVRDVTTDYDHPYVYNVSDGWLLDPRWSATAAGVLAEDYQATGGMLQWLPMEGITLSSSLLGSHESFGDSQQGAKGELRTSIALPGDFSLDLSAAKYSTGYRELTEALDDDFHGYQSSYSANLNWNTEVAGSFAVGYYGYQATDEYDDSRSIIASWGKTFKHFSINANYQHAVNQRDSNNDSYTNDDMFYVNISIPLGTQRVGMYMRNQGSQTSYGLQTNGSIGENTNYYISADRNSSDNENSFNGNINTNLHYTQLSMGAGSNGDNQSNYNASLSGGIAMHPHGVTFSPYGVKDTFGIARLSEPESGIEIATPQGRVWTDHWGQAVIPGMTEWGRSRVEINANTLPKSVDLANGIKNVSVAHASFSELDFKVVNTRRVMLNVKRPDGTWLAKGTTIVDEKNNYLVSSVDNGQVFISNVSDNPALYAVDDNMNRLCRIEYQLSESQDKEAFYETEQGVCK